MHTARFPLRFALFLLVAALASAADLQTQVDEYMNAQVKAGRFSGSILIARDGRPLVSKGYGMANLEWNVPNTPQTKFRLGSITKQFTATAILQLEAQGKLNVQDQVKKYLTDAPASWDKVTVHHLLTHTSGVPSYTSSPDYVRRMREASTPAEMIVRFKDKPLQFEPGAKFIYSNSGYFLLGQIIEKVSGESYEDYVRKHIFEPLGMRNSGYDHPETILPNRAAGYSRGGNGLRNVAYLDMGQPYSAGSLYSTVEDMLIWDQALYADKVLPKAALDRMFTPYKDKYGYGWFIDKRLNRKTIEHGGGINGFVTMFIRFPEEKVCVVALCNSDTSNVGRVAGDLAAIAFGEKYEMPRERTAIALPAEALGRITGKYELQPGVILAITRDGSRMMAQLTGQPPAEIFPESETAFFYKVVDAQLHFARDASGKVTKLVLHQGGREIEAKKIE